jgi:hypothetical protein
MGVHTDEARTGLSVLQEDNDCDVIFLPQSIVDIVLALGVGPTNRCLTEVDQLLIQKDVLAALEEGGASIDRPSVFFLHAHCTPTWPVDTLVIIVGKLLPEEVVVASLVNLLQTNDIRIMGP